MTALKKKSNEVNRKYNRWKEKGHRKKKITVEGSGRKAFMKHRWMYLAHTYINEPNIEPIMSLGIQNCY